MKNNLRSFLALAGSSLLAISYTHAGNTWDGGGGSGFWNNGTNWNADGLPGTGALTFTGDVQTSTTNDLVAIDPLFGGINFTNDGSVGKTNAFTLAGSRITLGGNIVTTANTTGSTITDVISLDMILNNNRTITTNQLSGSVQHNLTIGGVISQTGGSRSLTKAGAGTLTFNGSAGSTFTGGLIINGGTVALDYANMVTPTNLLASNNLTFKGGNLTLKGKTGGGVATAQSLGNVSVSAGGGTLLIDPNGGDSTTLTLGALDPQSQGGSLIIGKALGAGSGTVTITTTTNKNAGTGIYRPRIVFADGTSTGYDWVTTSSGGSPYTLEAYSAYSALDTAAGTDTLNSRISANTTLSGSRQTNTLKIETPAASQSLDLAGNNLTLNGGGLLVTGTNAFQITGSAGSKLIGQNGAGSHDLIVHQFNSGGLDIGVEIANNGANATALTKSGTGSLTLSGNNTFTGGVFINSGELRLGNAGALNSTAGSENAVNMTNGTTLSLAGNSVVVRSIASSNTTDLNGGAIIQNNSGTDATLTVGNSAGASSTYTGMINDGTGIGKLALNKTGSGTLTIAGTPGYANTYSGGTTVSGGTLTLTSTVANSDVDAYLGASSGGITLSGGGQLRATSTNISGSRIVTVGTGGGSLFVNKNNAFTTSEKITGSGALTLSDGGGSGGLSIYTFNSTANDFTGGIVLANSILAINSLTDSANNIVFNSTNGLTNLPGTSALRYGSSAVAGLNLSTRAIEFNSGATATGIAITNNNSTYAINIGTNLIATGAGAKTLTLDAVSGPSNVFSGSITDGTGGGTVGVTASGAGKWTLSNASNTFTGAIRIASQTLAMNSLSTAGETIFLGSTGSTGTLEYLGSGQSTGRQVQVAAQGQASGSANILNNGTGALIFSAGTFNISDPSTGGSPGNRNLTLGGSYTGGVNEIQGNIVANTAASLRDLAIIKTGAGSWKLSGTNSYTKTTSVQEGNLIAGSDALSGVDGAFGNATSEINLGVAGGNGDAAILIGGAFNVGRNIRLLTNNTSDAGIRELTIGGNTAHNSEFSGNIFLGTTNQAGRGLTLTAANGGQVTFSGVIQNPTGMDATTYAVTKAGAGTAILSNTNTYTGNTIVSEGTLVVSGNISTSLLTTVQSGATISGNGGTVGALTIESGGFINPGSSPGVLNTGDYNQFGLYTAEINGLTPVTQHDQISVTGEVDITGGSLATLFSGTGYAAGDLIFILLNDEMDAITGTYTGFAQGDTVASYGGFDWQIYYDADSVGNTFDGGNDIALFAAAPIPEPRTLLLGALGVLAMLRRRR